MKCSTVVVASIVLSLLVAGYGGKPANALAPSNPQLTTYSKPIPTLTRATVRLAWTVAGYDTPLILAKEKGFYKDAGLDVIIEEGKGSLSTAESVVAGHDTFGYCDGGTTASLIEKGASLKIFAEYVQKTPFSFIYRSATKFTTPADLRGKTVITGGGGIGQTFLEAALKKYGLTTKDVHLVVVQASAYPSTLYAHPDVVVLGYVTSDYPNIKRLTPDALFKSFAAFGINAYNVGLTTTTTEIRQHPDVVKAFVAATSKGWEYAVKHPNEAAAAGTRAFPQANKGVLLAGLKQTLSLLHTPATEGRPYGWMAESDWKAGLDALNVRLSKPVTDLYTNEFIMAK